MLLPAAVPVAAEVQPGLMGDTRIHDPSIIEVDGKYAAFGTGEQGLYRGAIKLKTSVDGVSWTNAGAIGNGVPKWAEGTLGFQPNNVWAPSSADAEGRFSFTIAFRASGTTRAPSGS